MAALSYSPDMGAATPEELQETLVDSFGEKADPRLPAFCRFVSNVVGIIRKHCKCVGAPTAPCIFVMLDKPGQSASEFNAIKEPTFDHGTVELSGRVWLASPVATVGWRFEHGNPTAANMGAFVEKNLKMGGCPALICDLSSTSIMIKMFPNGLAETEKCFTIEYQENDVDRRNLDDLLRVFYERNLRTPNSSPIPIWKQATKNIPVERTEHVLQSYLVVALSLAFEKCVVRPEEDTESGRVHIFLVRKIVNQFNYLAVLELKVLRSFTHTGETVKASVAVNQVNNGLTQIIAYKSDNDIPHAFLCCYDMRAEKTDCLYSDKIRERATKKDIELRSWYLFNSSKSYRESVYGD